MPTTFFIRDRPASFLVPDYISPSLCNSVLSDCPIFVGHAGPLCFFEDLGEIIGQTQACVPASRGFAEKARIFRAEINRGAGLIGRMKHDVAVGSVKG